MRYEIHNDIPPPRSLMATLKAMKVEEYITVPFSKFNTVKVYVTKVPGSKFAYRTLEENGEKVLRIWRVS